jgi:RNA polymerase sigma factor (sigma-70 family)
MGSNLHLIDDEGKPLPKCVVDAVDRLEPLIKARFSRLCDPADLSNSMEHEAKKIARAADRTDDNSVGGLSWRAVLNGAIGVVRKHRRRREEVLSSEALQNLTGISDSNPETELIRAERREALLATLATLSDRDREYLRLREQEFSDDEIAAYMKLSKNALAQVKHRLKAQLTAKGILPK